MPTSSTQGIINSDRNTGTSTRPYWRKVPGVTGAMPGHATGVSSTRTLNNPSVDEARLRPHLRERARLEERTRLHHQQAAIFRTQHSEALAEGRDTSMPTRSTAGGDKRKLRGIPVQARGVGSVQPGTQPEQAATRGQHDTPSDVTTFMLHANARRRAA